MQNDRLIDGSLRPFVRFMEHLYIQNNAMKKLLETVPGLNWRTEVAKLMAAQDRRDDRFAKISDSLDSPEDLHESIQEFLSIKHTL